MKKLVYFIVAALFLVSCTEIVVQEERSVLEIHNKTDDSIHVELYRYPNKSVLIKENEFDLLPNNEDYSYCWIDLRPYGKPEMEPYDFVSNMFDIIEISFPDKENATIIFTHEDVTGYSENIFTEASTWSYKAQDITISGWVKKKLAGFIVSHS